MFNQKQWVITTHKLLSVNTFCLSRIHTLEKEIEALQCENLQLRALLAFSRHSSSQRAQEQVKSTRKSPPPPGKGDIACENRVVKHDFFLYHICRHF